MTNDRYTEDKIYKRLRDDLKRTIEHIEERAIEDKGLIDTDAEELCDYEKFNARSTYIRKYKKAYQKLDRYITGRFNRELKFREGDKYPYGLAWICNNTKLLEIFEEHLLMTRILNLVYWTNRPVKADEFKRIIFQNRRIIGELKHKKKYEFATFITSKKFYQEMADKAGCSVVAVKKIFRVFVKIGILVILGGSSRNGFLYADGYFTKMPNETIRKIQFLRNTTYYRNGIKSIPELLKKFGW